MGEQGLQKRYSPQQMQEILQKAMHRQDAGDVTHQELLDTAAELGVDAQHVEAALAEAGAQSRVELARQRYLMTQRRDFYSHLTSYLATNGALLGMDYFTGMHGWSVFPLLGWGIGVVIHAYNAFMPSPDAIDRGTEKTLRKMEKTDARLLKARN